MTEFFEAFGNRVSVQSDEFSAAVSRIAARRIASACDVATATPIAAPEPTGMRRADNDVLPPAKRRLAFA